MRLTALLFDPPTRAPYLFLYNAQALNTDIHGPGLPVSIQSIMPHIHLQLGTDMNNNGCPSIRCVVDTAAALCTGNYHFFAAIAKRYPRTIHPSSYLASFRTMLTLSPLI